VPGSPAAFSLRADILTGVALIFTALMIIPAAAVAWFAGRAAHRLYRGPIR